MNNSEAYPPLRDQYPNSSQQDLAGLLTQVVSQEVSPKHTSHKLIFITSLAALLMGVMYADSQVTESEKHQLKKLISNFIPSDSSIGHLIKPIFTSIQQKKLYTDRDILSQLTQKLSESEKLLIIGFCYEVAAADGEIADKENRYIEAVSKILDINSKYLPFLSGHSPQKSEDEIVNEIHALLDPHYFQDLDPAFMRAASVIRAKLPTRKTYDASQKASKISYIKLKDFQDLRVQLATIVVQLLGITQNCYERDILPQAIEDEAKQLLEKVQSQRFRIAVVGEFSQGKSTLLNALLGEEIQPVRAIPCSGTVTVLKYGDRQRVICRYKDGQEEEIPSSQYQEIASISEQAALSNIAEELSKSKIAEIILEHPGLELCQHQARIFMLKKSP